MKKYEVVREIFNQCANNQMRDVFFEERSISDPERYILETFKDKDLHYEKSVLSDGSICFDIETGNIRQRYTFTEI